MHVRSVKLVFAVALLIGVSACSAPSQPASSGGVDAQPKVSTQPKLEDTEGSTETRADGGDFSFLVGGNAAGARRQMGWDDTVTFTDASGQGREVVDETSWKICSQEAPVGSTLVFGVVLTEEQC
jgi:hypothetical protein